VCSTDVARLTSVRPEPIMSTTNDNDYTTVTIPSEQKNRLDAAKVTLFDTDAVSYRVLFDRLLDDLEVEATGVGDE